MKQALKNSAALQKLKEKKLRRITETLRKRSHELKFGKPPEKIEDDSLFKDEDSPEKQKEKKKKERRMSKAEVQAAAAAAEAARPKPVQRSPEEVEKLNASYQKMRSEVKHFMTEENGELINLPYPFVFERHKLSKKRGKKRKQIDICKIFKKQPLEPTKFEDLPEWWTKLVDRFMLGQEGKITPDEYNYEEHGAKSYRRWNVRRIKLRASRVDKSVPDDELEDEPEQVKYEEEEVIIPVEEVKEDTKEKEKAKEKGKEKGKKGKEKQKGKEKAKDKDKDKDKDKGKEKKGKK